MSPSAVASLRTTHQRRVLDATAAAVRDLYDATWWLTPANKRAAYPEAYAERHHWLPPWRWEGVNIDDPTALPNPSPSLAIDEVAVARAIDGDAADLSLHERRQAASELHRRGLPPHLIAKRVGVHVRTIERYQATGFTSVRRRTEAA